NQLVILHPGRAVLEFAHTVIDRSYQIGKPVRHWRIDRETGVLRVLFDGPILDIGSFCEGNDLPENLDFLFNTGPAAEQHVDNLFKVEEPERQFEVSGTENFCLATEAVTIFVVRVDQENAQLRTRLHHLLQDDGDTTRLTDAG